MSVKGKEKAEDPISVVEVDEEEDESTNFFMKKRRRVVMRAPSPKRASVEPTNIPRVVDIDSDDEDYDAPERKRPVKPKKEAPMPEWMKTSTQITRMPANSRSSSIGHSKGKGKAKETVIYVDSSPEPTSPERREKGRELSLTPPPEMSEAKKALIAKIIRDRHALPDPAEKLEPDKDTEISSSSRPPASAVEDSVQITFRMVAPPERKVEGSSKAIEHFEKKRVITCGRTQPISFALQAFANQVRKPVADIVMTFEGRRIFSKLLTPQRIGVDYEAEFVCYEKDFWERRETDRRAQEAEIEGKNAEDLARTDASSDSEPATTADDKIRVILTDGAEEHSATIAPHVLAKSLVKYFISKSRFKGESPGGYRLRFDGEIIEPETKFEALGADEGDKIEVVKV